MNENILKKLKALLARANAESNDNENERAIAMRQAQALMDKYNLSLAEIEAGAEHGERDEEFVNTRSSLWKASVFNVISDLYAVKMYRRGKGKGSMSVLLGAEHNRIACLSMGEYLIQSIERESKKYAGYGKSYIHAFKMGAVSGIESQVDKIIAERNRGEALSETGNALVLADYYKNEMILNEDFLKNRGVNLTKGGRSRVTDGNGYANGRKYGSNLSLNNQLNGNGGSPKRLGR